MIPFEVRSTLRDQLTDRGMQQWWHGRNRALEDRAPSEVWETHPEAVIVAAERFGFGMDYYV